MTQAIQNAVLNGKISLNFNGKMPFTMHFNDIPIPKATPQRVSSAKNSHICLISLQINM